MIFFGVIASSCGLVHLCLDAYCQPVLRNLISFLILLWYFSTFVVAFFGPRAGAAAGAGTIAEQEREAQRNDIIITLVLVFLCSMVS